MLRIFSKKFPIPFSYGKIPTSKKQSNQSELKDSEHQSLIVNWLIMVRPFCIVTIWCEMKVGWNEHTRK